MIPSTLTVAGVPFLADPSGALFHEEEGALLVADLHLEKGSCFARRGMMLPPYDTSARSRCGMSPATTLRTARSPAICTLWRGCSPRVA